MDFRTLIDARRWNKPHSANELRYLAEQAALPADCPDRSVPDYQLSAWLMAAVLNPLSVEETADFTVAMAESGERLNLDGIPKPWVDKHSTGGVGDKTTLVLLPLLASCGLTMVKMSGRGLGITGGTIDKLESIPGFRTNLTPEELLDQAKRIGIALTGQTPRLAPADKTLYDLRDATATVASIPLIASSILSKKIAGGAETIVIDLKCGAGAFMKTREAARELAEFMLAVAQKCCLNLRIAISDMDNLLGSTAGNALEVEEAISVLSGRSRGRFAALASELAELALASVGRAATARMEITAALNGAALEKATEWIEAQGGVAQSLFDRGTLGYPAPVVIPHVNDGPTRWIKRIDPLVIGEAVVTLGGGRQRKGDTIDHRVGIDFRPHEVGNRVEAGDEVFRVHAGSDTEASTTRDRVAAAIEWSIEEFEVASPVLEIVE